MATKSLSTGVPKITTYDPSSAASLGKSLNNQFEQSDQYTGILDRYNQAQGATAANTQQTGQYISSMYGGNIDYEKLQTGVAKQGALESRRGFATNVAALTNLQKQGDQRVKALTDQANQALMANNAAGAQALSDLAVQEQTAITTARTNFLNQYFATQQEARSQASFRTPEQTAAIALAQQYPDAGIAPGDDLQAAQQKILQSPVYKNAQQKVLQDIESAKAQALLNSTQAQYLPEQVKAQLMQAAASQTSAGAAVTSANAQAQLAGAQSEQTRFLTDMYKGGGTGGQAQDVSGLLNGSITPQSLQAKYANVPNGGLIVSNILSQAQSQGYNLNSGTLAGLAQQKQTETLNSGNLLGGIGLRLNNLFDTGQKSLYQATDVGSMLHPSTGATQNVLGKTYKFDGKNWVLQK